MSSVAPFAAPEVEGFLHRPDQPTGRGMVLAHGAGSNCTAPLLVAVADAFAAAGVTVLRCNLAFRQRRPSGPPPPSSAALDRAGLMRAAAALGGMVTSVVLAGHSYGGRQASMLAAETPGIAEALLLLSYPLHPPRQRDRLRTGHFSAIRVPALFVHGTNDPFGTIAELEAAVAAIPAASRIVPVEDAGHDLKRGRFDLSAIVAIANALPSSARSVGEGEGQLP